MTITEFADDLAAVVLASVETPFDGIPRELLPAQLPAQWVDLPSAVIDPPGAFGSFTESAATYTGTLYVAVCEVSVGLPDDQRAAILEVADEVEAWAVASPYRVEITTARRIPVGNKEYRGVMAVCTLADME